MSALTLLRAESFALAALFKAARRVRGVPYERKPGSGEWWVIDHDGAKPRRVPAPGHAAAPAEPTAAPAPVVVAPEEEPKETTFWRPSNVTGRPTVPGVTFQPERGWVLPPGDHRVVRSFPEWYEETVRGRFAKLVKRAQKLGVPPPSMEVIGDEAHLHGSPRKPEAHWTERYVTVAITARPVRLHGYTFLGTIQHEDGGNIVRGVPGAGQIPVEYRTAKASWCDHCKTTRGRVDTFVVRDEHGRHLRVGRNCLADFVGSVDGTKVADLYTALDDVVGNEDAWGGGGGAPAPSHLLQDYVAQAHNVVRQHGYVSRRTAEDREMTSTSDLVTNILHARARPSSGNGHLRAPEYEPTDEDRAAAAEAIEWARTQTDPSDYGHNLRMVAKEPWLGRRTRGFAASIVAAHARSKQLRSERGKPAHFGAVGDKVGAKKGASHPPLTVTVLGTSTFEGDYGPTTLVRMEYEADGQRYPLVWRASGVHNLQPGRYTLTGTIKRHAEYKGQPQTEFTRSKLEPMAKADGAWMGTLAALRRAIGRAA